MKVVIFGATGAIGRALISILSKEQPSWSIYAVTRDPNKYSKTFAEYANVQIVQGDPHDKDDAMKLSADKDLVYSCIGFTKYEAKYWADNWPTIIDNLLDASSQFDGQKFVFCDNLYAYGPGQGISTHTPLVAASTKTKPGVRALIRPKLQHRMDHNRAHPLSVVGGADFFGPGVTATSFLGATFTKAIVDGKPRPLILGSSQVIHDFCFSRDFAQALYVAGVEDRANGRFWICPHAIHGKTIQEIADDTARIAGSTNSKVNVIPSWVIYIGSLLVSFLKEMIEMLPFWTQHYTIDDSEFCKTFNVQATPYEDALKANVDYFKASDQVEMK